MNLKRTMLMTVFVFTLLWSSFDLIAAQKCTSLELPKLNKNDVLIQHTGFSLVYSEKDEQALWVAYALTKEHAASKVVERDDENFRPDPLITTGSADDKDFLSKGLHMAILVLKSKIDSSIKVAENSFDIFALTFYLISD